MKIKILTIVSCFALFVILVFSQGLKTNKVYDTKDLIGKPISEVSLNLLNKDISINTKDLKENNFTLINFWASWCAPCKREHKYLMKLSKNKNLKILGINVKDKKTNDHFEDYNHLISTLKSFLNDDDKVLFKGSRGMQMEKIISGVFEN